MFLLVRFPFSADATFMSMVPKMSKFDELMQSIQNTEQARLREKDLAEEKAKQQKVTMDATSASVQERWAALVSALPRMVDEVHEKITDVGLALTGESQDTALSYEISLYRDTEIGKLRMRPEATSIRFSGFDQQYGSQPITLPNVGLEELTDEKVKEIIATFVSAIVNRKTILE